MADEKKKQEKDSFSSYKEAAMSAKKTKNQNTCQK